MKKAALTIGLLIIVASVVYFVWPSGEDNNQTSQTQSLQKVVINEAVRTLLYLPLYHAKEGGFFEKNGVDVEIVTQEGKPVTGFNNIKIHPHRAAEDVEATDVIIISSVADFEPLAANRKAIDWLKHHQ